MLPYVFTTGGRRLQAAQTHNLTIFTRRQRTTRSLVVDVVWGRSRKLSNLGSGMDLDGWPLSCYTTKYLIGKVKNSEVLRVLDLHLKSFHLIGKNLSSLDPLIETLDYQLTWRNKKKSSLAGQYSPENRYIFGQICKGREYKRIWNCVTPSKPITQLLIYTMTFTMGEPW